MEICHKAEDQVGHSKTMMMPWDARINGHRPHGDTQGPYD